MSEFLHPGVFVEEVSFRARSIEGVPTSTMGFVSSMLSQSASFRDLDHETQRAIAEDTARTVVALGPRFFNGRLLTGDDLGAEQQAQRPTRPRPDP